MSVGYDHLDLSALKERNIKVKSSLCIICVVLAEALDRLHIASVSRAGGLHSWCSDGCHCRHDRHFAPGHVEEAS